MKEKKSFLGSRKRWVGFAMLWVSIFGFSSMGTLLGMVLFPSTIFEMPIFFCFLLVGIVIGALAFKDPTMSWALKQSGSEKKKRPA